jgi:hypothetical protein
MSYLFFLFIKGGPFYVEPLINNGVHRLLLYRFIPTYTPTHPGLSADTHRGAFLIIMYHWLRPRTPPPPLRLPRIWAHIWARYRSTTIDDISLCPPGSSRWIVVGQWLNGDTLWTTGGGGGISIRITFRFLSNLSQNFYLHSLFSFLKRKSNCEQRFSCEKSTWGKEAEKKWKH